MCRSTLTPQGKFKNIEEHHPGVMISGFDTVTTGLKHTLYFIDPDLMPVCNAQATTTNNIYKFHEDDYPRVLNWLTSGGKIKLSGEPAGAPSGGVTELDPAGWRGVT